MKPELSLKLLHREADVFSRMKSEHSDPAIYGITDGKAVGTYFEHRFQGYLSERYSYEQGSSAKGIDFPDLGVDMKVTRTTQPQSSCPFKSARQKVYGLGCSLLVFVYDKIDDPETQTGRLDILHTIFIDEHRTADFQTTSGVLQIVENNGNVDDLMAFMQDRNLPIDDIQALALAEEILRNPLSIAARDGPPMVG
jgi:hypothetical protein